MRPARPDRVGTRLRGVLRLAALAVCCLILGACGSSSTPLPETGPDGLTVGDQEAMRQVGIAAGLYGETVRTTRTLLAEPDLEQETLEVRLDAELFRAKTIVERTEQEARLLRDPALVRGARKIIRILREQNQQYALAGTAKLAGDPGAVSVATARAAELSSQAEQTLRRLRDRFRSLPG